MARYKMFFTMIAGTLLRRKARMVIALLAVVIGAGVISGIVTVWREVPVAMSRAFRAYGANLLLLPTGENPTFAEDKTAEIKTILNGYEIVGITPFLYDNLLVNKQSVMAGGTDFAVLREVSPYWQIDGAWPKNDKEILLGAEFAQKLRVEQGAKVVVSGGEGEVSTEYTIAGVVRTGGKEESFVFLNLPALQKIKNRPNELSLAQISIVADGENMDRAVAVIKDNVTDVMPQAVKQIAHSEAMVLGKLSALVLIVTVVVLVLTLICVSTTMMAVVTERRKEIGLKKALGADNRNIVMEFLGEGCLLGFLGGILGVMLGYLFAQSVSINVFARTIDFSVPIAIASLVLSVAVTGAASMIPVRIATSVEPAIVLRGE